MGIDRKDLTIIPLAKREHDLNRSAILSLREVLVTTASIAAVAQRIQKAKDHQRAIIMMIGGHVIRAGVQRYIIDLMEQGLISCVAMNGAGMIHDFEFAMIGATTESVAKYIQEGQFGLWKETGYLNDIIKQAYENHIGMGEAVGQYIIEKELPNQHISLLAAGYRLGIPAKVFMFRAAMPKPFRRSGQFCIRSDNLRRIKMTILGMS